jgi:MFS family permease
MAFSPVQRRDLWLLATLRAFSLAGDTIALTTLYFRLAHGGHPWAVAALSIAGSLPVVALSPVAGFLVDHVAAKPLLVIVGLYQALIAVAIGLSHGALVTIVLMGLLAVGAAVGLPCFNALVPAVSGEDALVRGQSLLQGAQGVAQVAGPAAGGFLIGALGTSWPLYVDALTFLVGALGILALATVREVTPWHERPAKEDCDLLQGFRFILHDRYLGPLVGVTVMFVLTIGTTSIADVFFLTCTLHAGATDYGFLGAIIGGGIMLGSYLVRNMKQVAMNLLVNNLVGVAAIGLIFGLVGFTQNVLEMFTLFAVGGVMIGVPNVAWGSLLALRAPNEIRGRVFAAATAAFTGAELGATALGGTLLSVLSIRTLYWASGLASILTVLVCAPIALYRARGEVQGD